MSVKFKVGLTERHGMALEQKEFPPVGVEYQFLGYKNAGMPLMKSPMKGFMCDYFDEGVDLVEAVLTPARTQKAWCYSLACYQEALAFSFLGLPTPKFIRQAYMEHLFNKENFKGLLFWSEAGLDTMYSYGHVTDSNIIKKSHVVYPAIRTAPIHHINYTNSDSIRILFNGNFFIKGGANVVDVFESLQKDFPNIELRLCCDINIDFHTDDETLRQYYLSKIANNKSINMGRVSREEFVNNILPNTDIYLLPTYGDAFGFAVLEAMSYGIPVVSTNYMAIPEMIEHGNSGYMVDIGSYDCPSLFKGCYVKKLPAVFKEDVNNQLTPYMAKLIQSPDLRKKLGSRGIDICREKFSFSARRDRMSEIYQSMF